MGSALIDMYVKCGCVLDARQVFYGMHKRNNVLWTTMIAVCTKQGHSEDALIIFCQMECQGVEPNQFIVASVLKACAKVSALRQGKQVHAAII